LSDVGHCDFGVCLYEGFSKASLKISPVTGTNLRLS